MTKRIALENLNWFPGTQQQRCICPKSIWRATSRRYGVTAYGRTAAEAKSRLFLTRQAEYRNCYAAVKLTPPEEHRHFFGILT